MDLLVLAAGMGSRFGGLKQIEPIDERNNFIIDYSIYDAKRAGFDRVIFLIKEENREIFEETVVLDGFLAHVDDVLIRGSHLS